MFQVRGWLVRRHRQGAGDNDSSGDSGSDSGNEAALSGSNNNINSGDEVVLITAEPELVQRLSDEVAA